jgi:PAS domain S-box-containing protein
VLQDADTFHLLVSSVRDYAIFLLDADGHIVSWNAGAAALFGYGAEEVGGEHFSRFYPEEMQRRRWPQHELRSAAAEGRFEDEGWRVRKDGTCFWANSVITSLRDSSGELRGFAKVTRDLTERRRHELALQHSEERFRSLVEGVRDYAIFILDPEGIVTSWNAGARKIKGYESDEIIGSHFSRFYTPEAIQRGWPQHELEVANEQGHFEDEGWRVRKDGSLFWANVVITALRNASGTVVGYSKITRDRTERHKREESLIQHEERLRKHGEALELTVQRMRDFLATASHELRNSLVPIHLAASLMAKRDLDPPIEHLRQTIDRQSSRLGRIVEDLLDLNRVERGILSIEREQVLLANVLSDAIEASRPLIEARAHALQTQWQKKPVKLLGDGQRLTQVFINLLNNAARYTPVGGHISVLVETTRADVTVFVADTGKGIAPEMLERIFDPFTQLAPRDSDAQGGLGLGLALVRRIVELHGGNVQARSAGIGHGSEFVVTLPFRKPAAHPAREIRKKGQDRGGALRVLCVDDNRDVANSIARMLDTMGHKAEVAYDGAAALLAAHTLRPEIVLLDIDMPGMNGYEVARMLREQQDDPPPKFVALTGWGRESDKQRVQDAGFHRYVVKPVTPEALEGLLAGFAPKGTDGASCPSAM